jgi:hypothetical protein
LLCNSIPPDSNFIPNNDSCAYRTRNLFHWLGHWSDDARARGGRRMGKRLQHLLQRRRFQMELRRRRLRKSTRLSRQRRRFQRPVQFAGPAAANAIRPAARHRMARAAQSQTGNRRLPRFARNRRKVSIEWKSFALTNSHRMTFNNVECNPVIPDSPNVTLTSSSVPTAAKKHSCQPDSAHLFSHTGWCAKKQDGNNFIVRRKRNF